MDSNANSQQHHQQNSSTPIKTSSTNRNSTTNLITNQSDSTPINRPHLSSYQQFNSTPSPAGSPLTSRSARLLRSSQNPNITPAATVAVAATATDITPRNRQLISNPNQTLPGPSPAYTTHSRSRHSIYGTEDRVILELGSRLWKAGFSSETRPRIIISIDKLAHPTLSDSQSIWCISGNGKANDSNGSTMISVKSDAISVGLRRLFSDQLMIDPRQRKVLLIENALLPSQVRDQIATVLFDQLHVPSISFTPSSVLILMASGSVTGLVVDVGHLETTVTPVYLSRPLFPHLKSTTRAGSRLSDRLKVLLARYGQFVLIPKFATSLASNSVTKIPKLEPVPINLLTPAIIEDIKTRVLFVSQNELQTQTQSSPSSFSQQQQQTLSDTLREDYDESNDSRLLEQLERVYKLSTSPRTKDVLYKLPSHQKLQSNAGTTCIGIMRIPGWIRERCAEILFNPTIPRTRQDSSYLKEEEEESLSITESILECLLKLPLDLRKVMVSNIIIAGGGAMLPGFTSRLRIELKKTLTDCHFEPINFERRGIGLIERKLELERLRKSKKRYSPISSLADGLLILNDRLPLPPSTTTTTTTDNVITRPGGFQMNVLAWIGGSLAGSLRIGGQEIIRERWDSIIESSLVSQELDKEEKGLSKDGVNDELAELEEEGSEEVEWEKKLIGIRLACLILPEWTRMSLA